MAKARPAKRQRRKPAHDQLRERLLALKVAAKLENYTYATGTGQKLSRVHAPEMECLTRGCAIHHPTDPHQDWPTHWKRGTLYRQCPHGTLHPDKDHLAYVREAFGVYEERQHAWHECPCNCCKL